MSFSIIFHLALRRSERRERQKSFKGARNLNPEDMESKLELLFQPFLIFLVQQCVIFKDTLWDPLLSLKFPQYNIHKASLQDDGNYAKLPPRVQENITEQSSHCCPSHPFYEVERKSKVSCDDEQLRSIRSALGFLYIHSDLTQTGIKKLGADYVSAFDKKVENFMQTTTGYLSILLIIYLTC